MSLRKKEFLRRRTEPGKVEWVTGVFFLLFLGILLCVYLQMEMFRSSARYLEDALAASNLASAVIDVEEYGISHKVWIGDVHAAFERYKTAIKGNLNLNDAWECENRNIISGPVRVVDYTVYNVSGNDVLISHYNESGILTEWNEQLGSAKTPVGEVIENTGVYSEIMYHVSGMLGTEAEAHKSKLVDITAGK